MSRGKNRLKIMLDSSQAALMAGIEIHNKPLIQYRYHTSVILIINAWELSLKAFIYKYIGKKSIYEKDSGGKHTIPFTDAIKKVEDRVNAMRGNSEFEAVVANLCKLNDYRNEFSHFGNANLDPIVFMLLNKAVMNYNEFMKEFFSRDIAQNDNLIILPIGLKVPVDPVDFLRKRALQKDDGYVSSILASIKELQDKGVQETILVGFDFCMISAKKIKNADIIAAVDNDQAEISVTKNIRITNDPNAPAFNFDRPPLPLCFDDVVKQAKAIYPKLKQDALFYKILSEIKQDKQLCQAIYLDPAQKKSNRRFYYSPVAVQKLVERYKLESK